MTRKNLDTFPRFREVLATAAAHAELEEWTLRQAVDWIQIQLGRVDEVSAEALQSILDSTDENQAEAQAREWDEEDRDGWEGRNNG